MQEFAIVTVAHHEPILGIEEGKALGDTLDRVDQSAARIANLSQICISHLNGGVAKDGEQHIAVAAGGNHQINAKRGDALLVFALD
jgi:hypothetical protein